MKMTVRKLIWPLIELGMICELALYASKCPLYNVVVVFGLYHFFHAFFYLQDSATSSYKESLFADIIYMNMLNS